MQTPALNSKTTLGFTLIELMISIAIISVLAAISYPAFQSHTAKSNRSEAQNALTELANKQEIYYAQHNIYSSNVQTELGYGSQNSKPNGLYLLSATSCTTDIKDLNRCYEIRAQATDNFQISYDSSCIYWFINHLGEVRSSTDAAGNNETTETCW